MKNTMKKLVLLLAVIIMAMLFTISASADGPYQSGPYTYSLSKTYDSDYQWTGTYHATITSVSSSISGDVVIPSTLGGYPVTNTDSDSASGLFANNHNITSVFFPGSITYIEDEIFYCCKNLKSVAIGSGVEYIGSSAFAGCQSLESIVLPDGLLSIGSRAFQGCKKLTDITIPDSVSKIGSSAFDNCPSLKTIIKIPKEMTYIPTGIFQGCSSLTDITIHDGITNIMGSAYRGCTSLTNVVIPDSVSTIGNYAFEGCTSLTSVAIPDSVSTIGSYAFEGCTNLTDITIPNSVTEISYGAFEYCSDIERVYISDVTSWLNINFATTQSNPFYYGADLYINGLYITDLEIPEDITSVNSINFPSGQNIETVSIPKSLTDISLGTLQGCDNLVSVEVDSDNTAYCSIDGVLFNKDKTTLIYFPPSKSDKHYTVPNSVKRIERYAFKDCKYLESITIPTSVTEIGSSVFINYKSLKDIYFGGTEAQWNAISKGYNNFTGITIHFAGEIPPVDPPAPEPDGSDMPITPIEPEEPKPEDHEHDYDDDEDETCNTCGYDRTENCDCRCHNDSFFTKIFWKITNFFNKLFKKNATCICGIAHY